MECAAAHFEGTTTLAYVNFLAMEVHPSKIYARD